MGLGLGLVQGQGWAGVSLLLRSRCTFACEHLNCASKHTSRAALRSTGPWSPPSRPSSSEQPRAELVAVGWNVPCAKWYAARWNAWNASIDAVVDGVLRGDQEGQGERGARRHEARGNYCRCTGWFRHLLHCKRTACRQYPISVADDVLSCTAAAFTSARV